jgi:hypothetical protein
VGRAGDRCELIGEGLHCDLAVRLEELDRPTVEVNVTAPSPCCGPAAQGEIGETGDTEELVSIPTTTDVVEEVLRITDGFGVDMHSSTSAERPSARHLPALARDGRLVTYA